MSPSAEKDVHWGSVNARPTSLHGNGAASFDRATLNWHAVTCRLCLSLRGSENVPCPDKACSATHPGACRYPGWQMCMHPARVTPPGGSDARCAHENFDAQVIVTRLEDTGKFACDIKVWCKDCGVPFEFLGDLPIGVDLSGMARSLDGQELRLGIAPATTPDPWSDTTVTSPGE